MDRTGSAQGGISFADVAKGGEKSVWSRRVCSRLNKWESPRRPRAARSLRESLRPQIEMKLHNSHAAGDGRGNEAFFAPNEVHLEAAAPLRAVNAPQKIANAVIVSEMYTNYCYLNVS